LSAGLREAIATLRRDDGEYPVPESLRSVFHGIADALAAEDFAFQDNPIAGVRPIDASTAEHIRACINAYGDQLVPLDASTWTRARYGWDSDSVWAFIVDLSTSREAVSDLALHAKLHADPIPEFEIWSVHVP
jgi:hypothetical protein